ncbi:ASCH domain-containing protein [Candidatus Pacearchaeota archaeon]|nr:ASCH domain-containing protein [Candidatus Pacearchaeota archaeon]
MGRNLFLILHRKWFIEILEGRKKIEYRDVKPYWTKRLFEEGKPIEYSTVVFRNGYNKNAPLMEVQFKGTEKKGKYYEIGLGKLISVKNRAKLN